ncbi:type VI secretion system Vgr family protein, partial [Chitinimonas lacunae]
RPPRTTPRPLIPGPQTAVVVGPPGEEIWIDEHGRIKVQFHWDRYGKKDDKSSCWIRVAQPWAGVNFGMVAHPRIGQEVVVQFLDGNPDTPLVIGRVYNALSMPPWNLPANKTQTGILTRSTPKGGYDNANAIRFEDKKGEEQLWIHAEKNQDIEVENDETHWVGRDRTKTIDRDETVHVKRDRTETVDRDETITIHNHRKERVDHNETISIGDNRTEDVGKNEKITIGQNRTEDVGRNETITIGSNRTKTVKASEKMKIRRNQNINIGLMKTETIGMVSMKNVGIAQMTNIGVAYSLNVGATMNTVVGNTSNEQVGQTKGVNVGKMFNMEAGKMMRLTAGEQMTHKAGEAMVLVCGKSKITLDADGTITLQGVSIKIEGSEVVDVDSKLIDLN